VLGVTTPTNIALFGPWGSGKSSVYNMMKARIAEVTGEGPKSQVKVIRYDAWKYAGHSLQRDFLHEVSQELALSDDMVLDALHSSVETARVRLFKFLRTNWKSLCGAVLLAALVSALWAAAAAAWVAVTAPLPDPPAPFLAEFPKSFVSEFPKTGIIFGAVMAALIVSSQAMSSAVERRKVTPIEGEDQFFSAFDTLLESATAERKWWEKLLEKTFTFSLIASGLRRISVGSLAPAVIVHFVADLWMFSLTS
jgi:hypothetical protein